MDGVSLVICCHNSAGKLPPTINHINEMKVSSVVPWELIIVDNASADATQEVAIQHLSDGLKSICKVVTEKKLGLRHARLRGIAESQFEYISFIDDDNWVCSNWIDLVYEVMTEHPEVGVCGGRGIPVFESAPPSWFEQYQGCYAVGPQGESTGYADERGYLWGAGLTIRKSAWEEILRSGFSFTLLGRTGAQLSSGEDSEICLALQCYGWRLWYDARMSYYHYLPAFRLTWDYLKRLQRAFGAAEIVLGPYREFIRSSGTTAPNLKHVWVKDSILIIRYFWVHLGGMINFWRERDGSLAVLGYNGQLGKLLTIIKLRYRYDDIKKSIYSYYIRSPLYESKGK